MGGLLWSSALSTPMTEMPSLEKLTSSKGHQPLFLMITEGSLQDGDLDNGGHGAMHKRPVGGVEEIHDEGARSSGCCLMITCLQNILFKPNVSGEGSLSCKPLLPGDLEAVCRPQVLLLQNNICVL